MRLFYAAAAGLGCLPTALSLMEFLKPPAFTGLADSSENPVFVMGTTLDIEWTPARKGRKLSVVLYQVNATRAATFDGEFHFTEGPFEYITHDQVDATQFFWIVGTTRDLGASSMFAIAVWEEGAAVTDSTTNIFNITRAEAETTSTSTSAATSSSSSTSASSSSSSSTSTSTSTSSSTTAPVNAAATPPPAESQAAAAAAATGLSTGGAVGVGVGAAFAVMFLVGAGWYCARRRRRQHEDTGSNDTVMGNGNDSGSATTPAAELPEKMYHGGQYYGGSSPLGAPRDRLNAKSVVFEAPSGGIERFELEGQGGRGVRY